MAEEIQRTTGAKSAAVLERMAESRKRSLSLREDGAWLAEISEDPEQLVAAMASRRLLYRVGSGRYVLADRGTFGAEQIAGPEFLAAMLLRNRGAYFFSYLTAMIAYRLTDVHTTDLYAAVRGNSPVRRGAERVESYALRTVRLSDSAWPHEDELIRVRAFEGSREFFWRAHVERALLDALARPQLGGGFDHVVECWSRARSHEDVDWDRLCVFVARQPSSMRRRAQFMLRLLGFDDLADRHFAGLRGRGQSPLLDLTRGFEAPNSPPERDRRTGVLVNVPRSFLAGWTSAQMS